MKPNISNFKKLIVANASASLFVIGIYCMAPAYAGGTPAAGSLDITFNINGIVTTDLGYVHDVANATAIQSDGKIIVAGYKDIYVPYNQSYVPGAKDFALARYNTDGSLDTSFGTGGKVFTDLGTAEDYIIDIAIQSDGKIVVAGSIATYCTVPSCTVQWKKIAVVRYNVDGSLDSTFGTKGVVITALGDYSAPTAVSLQADGKILVGGTYGVNTTYAVTGAILRYNSNGTLDSSFGVNGVSAINLSKYFDSLGNNSAFNITDLALQTDGKIVAAGSATTNYQSVSGYNNEAFVAVRYTANGALDTSFNTTGVAITLLSTSSTFTTSDRANSVAIQNDGKIVLGGSTGASYLNSTTHFALTRYNSNGSLDATFGSGGKTITALGFGGMAYSSGMKLQSDGKIVMVGTANESVRVSGVIGYYPHFATARYSTDGTLDNRFGSQGTVLTFVGPIGGSATALAIQGDNKILAVGTKIVPYNNYTGEDFALLRYNP